MTISTQQRAAMAVLIAFGLLGGATLLLAGRGQAEAPSDAGKTTAGPSSATASAPAPLRKVELDESRSRKAGIAVEATGPGRIQVVSQFHGEVRFDEDRTAHVVPRLGGVAESVPARLGETVKKGQLLAVIASPALSEQRSELLAAQRRRQAAQATFDREERLWRDKISAEQDYLQARTALEEADIALQNSTQKLQAVGATASVGTGSSLNRFELRAPFEGTLVEKHLAPGEAVKEDAAVFTVTDLRTVWAEFAVAPKDLAVVRVGRKVVVSTSAFESKAEGVVSYVGALLGEQTRTARARVTLDNPQGAWRPGLFVTVALLGEAQDVALVVRADALQTVGEQQVVFKAVPGGFVATPVRVGRTDGQHAEVLDGLRAGDRVASSNTFLLKADLGKASVEEE